MSATTRVMAAEDIGYRRCKFVLAWHGACNALVTDGEPFCVRHRMRCASCNDAATGECSFAGQFVCGAPLCDRCEGGTTRGPSGAWGFLNHVHRRKDGSLRDMVAGDIGGPA